MKYYFSGIGGIGMSSLALYTAYKYGIKNVLGSNNEMNERVEYLIKKGIKVKLKQDSDLPDIDFLIKTTAIKYTNPELIEAKRRNITILNRMQLLNSILQKHTSIGITGTDGKTTTTAMVSQIFKNAGKDPTVFLGGIHDSLEDGNFRYGNGIVIAEVDESDGFIEETETNFSIINNLRPDHLEHYDNEFDNLESSLYKFANNTKELVLLNVDDNHLTKWHLEEKKVLYFGRSEKADYIIKKRRQYNRYQVFELYHKNIYIGDITLNLPGVHYAYDALASTALSLEFGIEFNTIKETFLGYNSVGRRFNILYDKENLSIIDDYAHTPDEILETIKATKEYFPKRKIITIFQPHRYTRLYFHINDFIDVLKYSDEVLVYRIYSAFEEPINGVDEKKVVEALNSQAISSKYYNSEDEIISDLLQEKNAVLLFVGAGDITDIAKKLSKNKKNRLYNKNG
ncbi:MAG: UDP-N-acetylmuramate--alanine ligase [Petrotoga sp.]|nr:UDP-N-acetylmuramate--alanine ligase [Petrotoga sp.]